MMSFIANIKNGLSDYKKENAVRDVEVITVLALALELYFTRNGIKHPPIPS